MYSFLFSCAPSPYRKGIYFKRKEFAPNGSKFFSFKVDPFLKGLQNNLTVVVVPPLNVNCFPLNKCKFMLTKQV